ncbi:MAG: VCBS repeat-containing protein, partial [Acidobacteria bacterium]|nr:VCBS repeat-containing protein [Acidobacteriota bacterium]MBI3655165.1 VCBS repeat-containing protein [Acidobacteriota bacterium]
MFARKRNLIVIILQMALWILPLYAQVSFTARRDFFSGNTFAITLATGDFNNDQILDLVVSNYDAGTLVVLLGDGRGGFVYSAEYPAGRAPFFAAVRDLNNDGNLDVVVANFELPQVAVLLGDGQGRFSPSYFLVGDRNTGIAIDDFNMDGCWDIATANFGPFTVEDPCGQVANSVSILLGDCTGNFVPPL